MQKEKLSKVKKILTGLGSAVIAYSGGTDSTLVLKLAYDVLGDKVIAITAVSASLPAADRAEAEETARQIGARHILIESGEFSDPEYLANTPERCYYCKKERFGKLSAYAEQHGYSTIIDGTNADDSRDFRPGRRAASMYNVRSPLAEVGLTKAEVRQMSRQLGLPNWDKPAAACLASRIPYGTRITPAVLAQVEHAESFLHELGLRQLRIRHHGQVARIEAESGDFPVVMDNRGKILAELKSIGFTYIALDLAGFQSGSMNAALVKTAVDGS
jgi:uncharacterized protein